MNYKSIPKLTITHQSVLSTIKTKQKMLKNKIGYLQISFAWLFALIVGAFILFLAIVISVKVIGIGQQTTGVETATQIGTLLNPLETGFESLTSVPMNTQTETRIYSECDSAGLGRQIISVSQKSFGKWAEISRPTSFPNKYLFSDSYVEGKKFYMLSAGFNFPFKVGNVIVLTSSLNNYCFVDAPNSIELEISGLQDNIEARNCSAGSIKICFRTSRNCDIKVEYDNERNGFVEKNGKRIYFIGNALMYGAIFSEPDIYECQVKRLMARTAELALIYSDKANYVAQKGCNSNINTELGILYSLTKNLDESRGVVFNLYPVVKEINEKNQGVCKLW